MTSDAPLAKLHDFYQPPSPAWTPQTVGWYVLFAIIAILLLGLSVHLIRKWRANRYRREALRSLATASPNQFSELLKRTALAAWPRESVASLSGEAWLDFLNKTSGTESFHDAPANRIEEVALRSIHTSAEDEEALRSAAFFWIRRHRVQA